MRKNKLQVYRQIRADMGLMDPLAASYIVSKQEILKSWYELWLADDFIESFSC